MKLPIALLIAVTISGAEIDEVYRSVTDFSMRAGSMNLAIHRAYSYAPSEPGLLGAHWSLN